MDASLQLFDFDQEESGNPRQYTWKMNERGLNVKIDLLRKKKVSKEQFNYFPDQILIITASIAEFNYEFLRK